MKGTGEGRVAASCTAKDYTLLLSFPSPPSTSLGRASGDNSIAIVRCLQWVCSRLVKDSNVTGAIWSQERLEEGTLEWSVEVETTSRQRWRASWAAEKA